MASREDLLRELSELKALRNQLAENEAALSAPIDKSGDYVMPQSTDLQGNPITIGDASTATRPMESSSIREGTWSESNPIIAGLTRAPMEIAGGLAGGLLTGGNPAGIMAGGALAGIPANWMTNKADDLARWWEGKSAINREVEPLSAMLEGGLTNLPIPGREALITGGGRSQVAREALEAGFNNEGTQAALQYAERNRLLNRPASKIGSKQNLTPDEVRILTEIERKANDPYSLGQEIGTPLSSANTGPAAAANDLARQSVAIENTNILQGGNRINPLTGRFEGASTQPKTVELVLNDAITGQQELMAGRKIIVNDLTQAATDLQVPGITFETDVLTRVGDLRELIAKRGKLDGTDPIAAQMQEQIVNLENSFRRVSINNADDAGRFMPKEISLKDAHDILENVNVLRRTMQEFDRNAQARVINGQASSPFDNGAAITALQDLHTALGEAVAQKSGEIITKAKQAPQGMFPWSNPIQFYDEGTIRRVNDSYGALATFESALKDQRMQTVRGGTPPGPATWIAKVDQAQMDAANPIPVTNPKQGFIGQMNQAAGSMVRGAKEAVMGKPMTPEAEQFLALGERSTNPIQNIIDLMTIKRNPLPVLSRDFLAIKGNQAMLLDLGERAAAIGILAAPQMIYNMSELEQKLIHQQVLLGSVGPIDTSPLGMKSYANGKINDPMEQDLYKKKVLEEAKTPADRARVMSKLFDGGTYEPLISETTPAVPTKQNMALPDINTLNSTLDSALSQPDLTYDSSSSAVLDELTSAQERHFYDDYH